MNSANGSRPVAMYGEQSTQISDLFDAMSQFQGDITNVQRNVQGEYGMYADLSQIWESVRPALSKHGLSLIQVPMPYGSDGSLAVVSTLAHKTGQFIRSAIPLTPNVPLQALAADVTYARRIAMGALLGIAVDPDDDGKQSKANHQTSVIATDAAWYRRAKDALEKARAEGNDEEIAAIHVKVHDSVAQGKMSQANADRLREEFPLPKRRKAKAEAPKQEEVASVD